MASNLSNAVGHYIDMILLNESTPRLHPVWCGDMEDFDHDATLISEGMFVDFFSLDLIGSCLW